MIERDPEAFEDVVARLGFAQLELGPPTDHVSSKVDEAGSFIVGCHGAVQAYTTGRGSILMRAKSERAEPATMSTR